MRRGMAVVMVWAIFSNAIGVSAQSAGRTPVASPFSRDAIHRAVAATTAAVTVTGRGVQGKADWQRVQNVRPGSDILLILNGGVSASRVLVESDDTGLTVMKLDGGLPLAVTETLGDLVRSDPQQLLAISRGASWSSAAKKISLTAEGVFLADRKISEWSSLLIRIGKVDVIEVRTGKPGGLGRGVVGFLIGYVGGSLVGWLVADDPDNSSSPYVGGVIGGVAGAIWFTRDARGLIYRR